MNFHLAVFASDHDFYEGECESLIIPMEDGQYGVQANHVNSICAIVPGLLSFQVPGEEKRREAVVSNGIMKFEENDALILVNTCDDPTEIDVVRAERAKEEAERLLREKLNRREFYKVQANLVRALNRLKASRRNQH